jgi:hypothetical protein
MDGYNFQDSLRALETHYTQALLIVPPGSRSCLFCFALAGRTAFLLVSNEPMRNRRRSFRAALALELRIGLFATFVCGIDQSRRAHATTPRRPERTTTIHHGAEVFPTLETAREHALKDVQDAIDQTG